MVDASRFRRWLINKLKVSRWSNPNDTPIGELALLLGVQPDVILEAQAELDAERKAAGLPVSKLGRPTAPETRQVEFAQLTQALPREVYEQWVAVAQSKNIKASTLLRSAVHSFLSQTRRPHHEATRGWIGDGGVLRVARETPYVISVRVSSGAKEALTRAALVLGCSEYALVRSIMLDTLSGRLAIRILTSHTQMWEDPMRYPLMGVKQWS